MNVLREIEQRMELYDEFESWRRRRLWRLLPPRLRPIVFAHRRRKGRA